MKILLIVPAYNEEQSIVSVCNNIKKYAKHADYIVINDGSTDRTSELCEINKIPCINLFDNLGIGGAVQTGYIYAEKHNYDMAIQFDGDGQHDIKYLNKLLEPIKKGQADLCVGSRFIDDKSDFRSTITRRFGIKLISVLIKILTGEKITDPTSGFRAVNKKVIAEFAEEYPTDFPESESLVSLIRKGYKIKEVPVNMYERISGISSITMLKSIYYMIKVTMAIIIKNLSTKRRLR
jgi:glycosyltransferase involved in cell wall biosynthesis